MRLIPRSLAGRLQLAAAAAIVVALLLAGIAIALILQRFVIGQIDQRLDGQIYAVAAALQRDGNGKLVVTPMLNGPPFDRQASGWYWQVTGPGDELVSASLVGHAAMKLPPLHPGRFEKWFGAFGLLGRPAPADGPGLDGQYLHWRVLVVPFGSETATVAATAPYQAIYGPLREALMPLALALVVLGLLLFGAMLAQVRLGLRPLVGLRAALASVRAGKSSSISTDQPSEILPLVNEVNSLLADNAEGLGRARRHVANLAHGLKTPLASLGLALEKRPLNAAATDSAGIAAMRSHLELMERLIRHHLARARAAVLAGPARASTNVAERLTDLIGMMGNVHRDRGLTFQVTADSDLGVAVETQDFDEILGNLLDNACKWARSRVAVSARVEEGRITIDIDDDGAGLDEASMPEVMRPGRRIDEATPGHGFGLPIAAELTELYGGSLELSQAERGGLRARVTLPQTR